MFPPPLNKLKDDVITRPSIAGCSFDPLNGKCSCGKVYSDISSAPKSAIEDQSQIGIWCHYGALSEKEWEQIQAENDRILACCRS